MNSAARVFTGTFLVFLLLACIPSFPAAARSPVGYPPFFQSISSNSSRGDVSPAWEGIVTEEGDILVDAFEYWDGPLNQGWQLLEPSYPIYGFGLGFVNVFTTLLDLQQGSRVLDVQRPASIFLFSTFSGGKSIRRSLFTPPSPANPAGEPGISLAENGILSFDFRAPLGIDVWDIFELTVTGRGCGRDVTLRIIPLQPPSDAGEGVEIETATGRYRISPKVSVAREDLLEIDVYLGRGFLDGSWHTIRIDCT
ncbi:MAG: hypothetical protein ACMUIL_02780, partial [bacterium]